VTAAARRAVALHPKVILLFVTPWDMHQYAEPARAAGKARLQALPWLREHLQWRFDALMKPARDNSRFVLVMRGFLDRDDQDYVAQYGAGSDLIAFLRPKLPSAWDARVDMVARFAEPIAAEAARSGTRFAVVYIPSEPAVLLARGLARQPDYDPYSLQRSLDRALSAKGLGFIDTLPAFGVGPAPPRQFYRINGHPNAAGHTAIAVGVAGALEREGAVCRPPEPDRKPALNTMPVATADQDQPSPLR
jgi:hypothetical protein